MKKTYLDNQDFHRLCTELCSKILPFKNKFDWIVGIERGGVPISSWLSYVLNKNYTTVQISTYDTPRPVINLKNLPGTIFLLVDDIVDTGNTIRILESEGKIKQGSDFYLASLHWCPSNSPFCKPDFYVATKEKNEWIVYPWEKNMKKTQKLKLTDNKL